MQSQTVLNRDIDRLTADTRGVIGDVRAVLADTGGLADEKLAAVRDAAERRIREALAHLDDVEKRVTAGVERAVGRTDQYASEHPWQLATAVSMAAIAVGLAIALVFRQR